MLVKLTSDIPGYYMLVAYECDHNGRWHILEERWKGGVRKYVYIPNAYEESEKVEFVGRNCAYFIYSDRETYLRKCTFYEFPSWVKHAEVI